MIRQIRDEMHCFGVGRYMINFFLPEDFALTYGKRTGMKCLPHNKISQANGIVVHDWHAEILAIRSFNRFLLQECYALANQEQSEYVRKRAEEEITESLFQPFALRDEINLHMYCSEAPCMLWPF